MNARIISRRFSSFQSPHSGLGMPQKKCSAVHTQMINKRNNWGVATSFHKHNLPNHNNNNPPPLSLKLNAILPRQSFSSQTQRCAHFQTQINLLVRKNKQSFSACRRTTHNQPQTKALAHGHHTVNKPFSSLPLSKILSNEIASVPTNHGFARPRRWSTNSSLKQSFETRSIPKRYAPLPLLSSPLVGFTTPSIFLQPNRGYSFKEHEESSPQLQPRIFSNTRPNFKKNTSKAESVLLCQKLEELGESGQHRSMLNLLAAQVKTCGVKEYNTVMQVLLKARRFNKMFYVYRKMTYNSVKPDTTTMNVLISSKVGLDYKAMQDFYAQIALNGHTPNTNTYNLFMKHHFETGEYDMVLNNFEKLKDNGLAPNPQSFFYLWSICAAQGRFEEIVKTFEQMSLADSEFYCMGLQVLIQHNQNHLVPLVIARMRSLNVVETYRLRRLLSHSASGQENGFKFDSDSSRPPRTSHSADDENDEYSDQDDPLARLENLINEQNKPHPLEE